MTTPDALMHVARALAQETATLIIDGRSEAEVAATKSSPIDIVTQMDLKAERLLRDRLAELRPHDAILGEEGDDVPGTSGITWVLDPIDGTVNYLYGLPHFAVSVAAVSGDPTPQTWTPLAGAVCDGSGVMWSASRGGGAWRNAQPLLRTAAPSLDGTLLGTGFQYVAEQRVRQGEIVTGMLGRVRDIRRLGVAAVDLCLVAAGHLDAYYEHGLHPWDFAAAALIAQEAGVRVAGIDGGPPDGRLTIAAMPAVWDELAEALIEAGADRSWGAP
ncbi:inositol monophosphatase family protein [Demequina muriae]|uniref:Inositol-1-monophosphatase n=1 Tax=Demequina muriae TaxID=3051664 RepID=A0ABT8GJI7_9MICO|nr:inositol monophosphatase family protein [Demequina sp. EGI L300058]MDN4481589.1 inositol monophosphatase family protein [Demequina sp. EGI L300058]